MVRQPLVYIANKNTARSGASSIVVTVGTSPPGQGEDRRTDHGSTDQRRKRRIPTGPLYEQPEAPTRNDRASVAEQPAESARRGCGPFGRDIGRSDAHERLKTVDEESGRHEDRDCYGERRFPVEGIESGQAKGRHRHADDTGSGSPPAEQPIRGPPGGEHAGDAGDLEGRNAPAGKADIHMQMFLEHRRSPVQYGETHNINEEVAHGNDPNRRIQKNLTTQECLILGIFFGPGLRLLPSGFSGFQFGKPDR